MVLNAVFQNFQFSLSLAEGLSSWKSLHGLCRLIYFGELSNLVQPLHLGKEEGKGR